VGASVAERVVVVPHVGLQLPKDPGARQEEIEKYVTASVEMLAEGLRQVSDGRVGGAGLPLILVRD